MLVQALNASLFSAASSAGSVMDIVLLGNSAIFGVAMCVFAYVAGAVMLPSARSVVREQREIFDVFSEVELHVVRQLRDSLASRFAASIRAAKADRGGAGGADDDDGGGEGGEGGGDREGGGGGGSADGGGDEGGEEAGDDGGGGADAAGKHGHRARHGYHSRNAHRDVPQVHHTIRVEAEAVIAANSTNMAATHGHRMGDFGEDAAELARDLGRTGRAIVLLCPCLVRPVARLLRQRSVESTRATVRRRSGREYSKAGGETLPLVLRLVWPIAVFLAYYLGAFLWRRTVVTRAEAAHTASLWTAELQLVAPLSGYLLRNALFYDEPRWVAENLNLTAAYAAALAQLADNVAYGNAAMGLPSALGTNQDAYNVLLVNGCVHNEVSADECENYGANASCVYYYVYDYCYKPPQVTDQSYPVFYYGVVGTGLLPTIQQYVLLVQAAVASRAAELTRTGGGTLAPLSVLDATIGIPGVLSPTDFDALDRMTDAYLPAGLGALADATRSASVNVITSFTSTDVLVTALSFVALVLLYVGYYVPTITALDADLKRTRFLLLLFPEEVARNVPAVVNAGRKLIEGAL